MVTYDEKIIYEFAERLYKQADTLLWSYGFIGAVLGFLLGYLGSIAARSSDRVLFALVGAGICAGIGIARAQGQVFELRLKAQTALCHAKIEQNTRPGGA